MTSRQIAELTKTSKNPILRLLRKLGWTRHGKESRIGRTTKAREYLSGFITKNFWNNLKKQANIRGINFEITPEYAWNLYVSQNEKCQLSGLKLNIDEYISSREGKKRTKASLDRIDSSIGYIEGNVQWVHKLVNRMKMDIRQEEFIKICKLISERFQ